VVTNEKEKEGFKGSGIYFGKMNMQKLVGMFRIGAYER
jgi:hypothetical protein